MRNGNGFRFPKNFQVRGIGSSTFEMQCANVCQERLQENPFQTTFSIKISDFGEQIHFISDVFFHIYRDSSSVQFTD